jgi:hypothetical protein
LDKHTTPAYVNLLYDMLYGEEVIISQESPKRDKNFRDFDWDKDRFVEYRSPLQRKKTLLFGSKSSLEYNTSVIDNQQKLKVRFTVGTEIVI